jgi:hypothetical protein
MWQTENFSNFNKQGHRKAEFQGLALDNNVVYSDKGSSGPLAWGQLAEPQEEGKRETKPSW